MNNLDKSTILKGYLKITKVLHSGRIVVGHYSLQAIWQLEPRIFGKGDILSIGRINRFIIKNFLKNRPELYNLSAIDLEKLLTFDKNFGKYRGIASITIQPASVCKKYYPNVGVELAPVCKEIFDLTNKEDPIEIPIQKDNVLVDKDSEDLEHYFYSVMRPMNTVKLASASIVFLPPSKAKDIGRGDDIPGASRGLAPPPGVAPPVPALSPAAPPPVSDDCEDLEKLLKTKGGNRKGSIHSNKLKSGKHTYKRRINNKKTRKSRR